MGHTHIYVYLYLYDLSLDDTEENYRCNTDTNIFYSIWLWIQNNKLQNRIDAHTQKCSNQRHRVDWHCWVREKVAKRMTSDQ